MNTAPNDPAATPPACRFGSRPALTLLGIIVFLALPIRLYLALTATMLSRDGVTFIWYAQHFAESPIAEMRKQDQHPLYPAMILAAHWCIERVGGLFRPLNTSVGAVLDDPVKSWTLAGMSATLLGGLAVIVAVYLLTRQLFDRRTGLLAAVLAALAAEFCQLSADALTDMPHLALYLFALTAGIRGLFPAAQGRFPPLARGGEGGFCGRPTSSEGEGGRPNKRLPFAWLFLCGLLSGLAFLMRPEGAAPAIVAVAGAVALAKQWRFPRRLAAALTITVAAALVAAPYMSVTGKLVQKKSPFRLFGAESSAAPASIPGAFDAPKGRRESSHGWSEARLGDSRAVRAEPVVDHLPIVLPPRQGRRESLGLNLTPPLPGRADDIERRSTTSSASLHWWLLSPGPFGADDGAPVIAGQALSSPGPARSSSVPALASADTSPWSTIPTPILAASAANPVKSASLIVERWGRALRVTLLLPAIAWLVLRKRFPAHAPAARLIAAAGVLHMLILFALIRGFDYADLFSVRHTMILAGLTLPFSAAGLAVVLDLLPAPRRTLAGAFIILLLVAPTTPWMFAPRNAADLHLRRAGEWIRAQQPVGATIHTDQHPVAFYANGQCQWSPREADAARILAEARAHRPDWLVFDLQRAQKACPGFPADLEAAAQSGELTIAKVEPHFAKGRLQQALIYRYHPPP